MLDGSYSYGVKIDGDRDRDVYEREEKKIYKKYSKREKETFIREEKPNNSYQHEEAKYNIISFLPFTDPLPISPLIQSN